jgi:hypothetical protein
MFKIFSVIITQPLPPPSMATMDDIWMARATQDLPLLKLRGVFFIYIPCPFFELENCGNQPTTSRRVPVEKLLTGSQIKLLKKSRVSKRSFSAT